MTEPRTPELDAHEYLATVDAWLDLRARRLARRRALRWFRPWPLAAITNAGATR